MCNKKKWMAGLLVGIMCLMFMVTDKQSVRAEGEAAADYIVCTEQTNLYEQPDWKDSKILASLPKDGVMTRLGEEGLYTKVNYKGTEGYIDSRHVGYNEEAVKAYEAELALIAYQAELERLAKSEEVRMIAAMIQCEAGNQPMEGQIAVGAVIMNRVRSDRYPNTVAEVLHQPSQFGPADSERYENLLANDTIKESCREAATQAYLGVDNVGGALHFMRAGKKEGIVIGNHVFY